MSTDAVMFLWKTLGFRIALKNIKENFDNVERNANDALKLSVGHAFYTYNKVACM